MSRGWRRLLLGLGLAFLFYSVVCLDVILRARDAYLKGEQAATPQMAFVWYETAATLFTPPESKWSRLSREKMPIAKARWKADLKARGIHFDEAMLD